MRQQPGPFRKERVVKPILYQMLEGAAEWLFAVVIVLAVFLAAIRMAS